MGKVITMGAATRCPGCGIPIEPQTTKLVGWRVGKRGALADYSCLGCGMAYTMYVRAASREVTAMARAVAEGVRPVHGGEGRKGGTPT